MRLTPLFWQMVLSEGDVNSLKKWDLGNKINVETHATVFEESDWREQSRLARFKDPVSGGIIGVKMWAQTCNVLLDDAKLLQRLGVRTFTFHEGP
jgi:hypothetical protein